MLTRAFIIILLSGALPAAAWADENPLEISLEMRQFIGEKIGFGLDPMQRLQFLVSSIFQDKSLNFTYSSVSRTAEETFLQRNGNCLSFTLMFISMARYLDLDTHFSEVNIPPTFTRRGELHVLVKHLKPIVFISGKAYAIDIFPAIIPIGVNGEIVSDQRGLAHYFSNKGVVELGRGEYGPAETSFNKALAIDDTTFSAWLNLGTLRFRTDNVPEAERCYRKALSLEPKNPAGMLNLANVYERYGREKEAERLKKKVQQFREKNPYYHYDLGLQSFQKEDFSSALNHYQQAVSLNHAEPVFYMEIARTYAKMGQIKRVLAYLKLAVKYSTQSEDKIRYEEKLTAIRNLYAAAGRH